MIYKLYTFEVLTPNDFASYEAAATAAAVASHCFKCAN